MKAIDNPKSNTAITRLIPFAFALMLVFTSLAASGCGVVDSNGGDGIETVHSSDITPEDNASSPESEDGDESATPVDEEEGYPDGPPAPPVSNEDCKIVNGRKVCP